MDLYNLVVSAKLQKGGGGDVEVDALNVTENGVYSASSGHAFDPVTVSVPTGVFPSGTKAITSNGMYDVTDFASASVNVPGIVPSGTSSITANGIYDITNFASVDVNVSGGGGGITADEVAMRTISGVVSGSASIVNANAFAYTKITEAYFPNAGKIMASAFLGCASLSKAIFTSASIINASAFANCTNFNVARFDNVTSIASSAFLNASRIKALYFLASEVPSITSKTFAQMYFDYDSGGSIYVRPSLVEDFKSATYWSSFASRITAYEGE